MTRILAVAGDVGGAAAVGPVILHLRREGTPVTALAYAHAAFAWEQQGVGFEVLDEQFSTDEARRHLSSAAVLLVGTSVNEVNAERTFTRVARSLGIPSLAVLDMWSNYSMRFGATAGDGPDVPDKVALMDDAARSAMVAEGFAPSRLVVTGHPGFDDLAAARTAHNEHDRAAFRRDVGAGVEERVVLFASQPLRSFWGEDPCAEGHPGFTEQTVLDALVPALESVLSGPVLLVIRPHPRETTRPHAQDRGLVRTTTSAAGNPRTAVMSSDVVVGMSTMLLVESALLGVPTVSAQLGLRAVDPLPNPPGLVKVFDQRELGPALRRTLSEPRAVLAPADAGSAAERVARLVLSLTKA